MELFIICTSAAIAIMLGAVAVLIVVHEMLED